MVGAHQALQTTIMAGTDRAKSNTLYASHARRWALTFAERKRMSTPLLEKPHIKSLKKKLIREGWLPLLLLLDFWRGKHGSSSF